MEIECLFGNLRKFRWSSDYQYYSIGWFDDGDRCSSSFGIEVLESAY